MRCWRWVLSNQTPISPDAGIAPDVTENQDVTRDTTVFPQESIVGWGLGFRVCGFRLRDVSGAKHAGWVSVVMKTLLRSFLVQYPPNFGNRRQTVAQVSKPQTHQPLKNSFQC